MIHMCLDLQINISDPIPFSNILMEKNNYRQTEQLIQSDM